MASSASLQIDPTDVSSADIERFATAAQIRDSRAFKAVLKAFLRERLGVVDDEALAQKAQALLAPVRWTPQPTELQRGRAALLQAFDAPGMLPVQAFAQLAGKSRQQIYSDLKARRLLALTIGPRQQRLPDWQLDAVKLRLTHLVLETAAGSVDDWTLFRILSDPMDALNGRPPIKAVTPKSIGRVAELIGATLGLQERKRAAA
jgi:hypothetical protein